MATNRPSAEAVRRAKRLLREHARLFAQLIERLDSFEEPKEFYGPNANTAAAREVAEAREIVKLANDVRALQLGLDPRRKSYRANVVIEAIDQAARHFMTKALPDRRELATADPLGELILQSVLTRIERADPGLVDRLTAETPNAKLVDAAGAWLAVEIALESQSRRRLPSKWNKVYAALHAADLKPRLPADPAKRERALKTLSGSYDRWLRSRRE